MLQLPLIFIKNHLFVSIDGADWLIDTGAPISFGSSNRVKVEGKEFEIPSTYMGLNPMQLSEFIKYETAGIIGADILGNVDLIFDAPSNHLYMSHEELKCEGKVISTNDFMGVPIIEVRIKNESHRMFFDTGAQISYFQDDSLSSYPSLETVQDFFPGFGQFDTETHLIDITIEEKHYSLQCGTLPALLGMMLVMAGTDGIIGHEIMRDKVVGFFPRRQKLIIP